jgi:hypothetical protein
MKYLNINTIKEVSIYTDDTNIPSGYGIYINDVILTACHIVHNKSFIKININEIVMIELIIDEYDIAILKKIDKIINYDSFLIDLKSYINNNNKIKNINSYKNNIFKLKNENINMIDIECDYIKTNIFPQLPVFIFSSNSDIDYSGYSGSAIISKNNLFGILISEKINDGKLTCLPIEIIYYILQNYIHNKMNFYYMPINMKNNIVCNNFRNLVKNDIIYKINNIELNNDMIYDNNLENDIPYDTYLILNGFTDIKIEFYRNNPKNKKKYMINIKLKVFSYKYVSFDFRDKNINYDINGVIFSELSEEKLIEMYKQNIIIPKNLYDMLHSTKKIIFIKDIINYEIKDKFIKNNINIFNELYIINKISGKQLNNINDLNNFKNNKNITFDMLNSDMNSIKIKI